MSVATLEKASAVDAGSDLASLVVAYHRRAHTADSVKDCSEHMCRIAMECVELDAMFFGTGD